jgi:hypothetical protein
LITVRIPQPSDREAWNVLYQGYADFYKVEQSPEMRDRVWSWLHDAAHESNGLMAFDETGKAVGLAHYRAFARPLSANAEIGKHLIAELKLIGKQKNWSVIRWITAENNYRARSSYDKIATRTGWVTYDIKL